MDNFNLKKIFRLINSEETAVNFLQSFRIIQNQMLCDNSHAVKLSFGKQIRWRCQKKTFNKEKGLRTGNWLQGSRMNIETIVRFIYCWSKELTSGNFCDTELKMCRESFVDYNNCMRELCVWKMETKYYGRRRNCYRIAIKFLQKALKYTTIGRKIRPGYIAQLRLTRLQAACDEHDISYNSLTKNLLKCEMQLDNKCLETLAIWEPRSFKCLTEIARMKEKLEASKEVSERLTAPEGVITRGML